MRLLYHEAKRKYNVIMRGEVHAYDSKEEYEAYKKIWERAGFKHLIATEINGCINVIYTRMIEIKGVRNEQ